MPTLDDLKNIEAAQEHAASEQTQEVSQTEADSAETTNENTEAQQVQQEVYAETPNVQTENQQTVFANEQLAEANAFMQRTGKTLEDYLNLKKPVESFNKEDLIMKYLTEKEGKTESEAKLELLKLKVEDAPEDDDFFDDEQDEEFKLQQKAKQEKLDGLFDKAKNFHELQVAQELGASAAPQNQEPQQPQGFEDHLKSLQESQMKEVERLNLQYKTDLYSELPALTEIPMTIDGETVKFRVSDEMRNEIKETTENLASVANQYFDTSGSGKLTNASGLMTEVSAWINPKTRGILLAEYAREIRNRVLAETEISERNITLSQRREVTEGTIKSDEQLAAESIMRDRRSAFQARK